MKKNYSEAVSKSYEMFLESAPFVEKETLESIKRINKKFKKEQKKYGKRKTELF